LCQRSNLYLNQNQEKFVSYPKHLK
jgi:hypothetical protein